MRALRSGTDRITGTARATFRIFNTIVNQCAFVSLRATRRDCVRQKSGVNGKCFSRKHLAGSSAVATVPIATMVQPVLILSFVVTLTVALVARNERTAPAATYREPSGAVPRETFHRTVQPALFIAREGEGGLRNHLQRPEKPPATEMTSVALFVRREKGL